MKVIVVRDDGSEVDVTAGVQVLYDSMASSMDWGSGFLDTEEVDAIRRVGYACGFEWIDYSLDVCTECGHRVGDHFGRADDKPGKLCRNGWQTRTAWYVLADDGQWDPMTQWLDWHQTPEDRRKQETIVDKVGCSCAGYAYKEVAL